MTVTRKLSKRRPLPQSQPIPQSSSEVAAAFAESLPNTKPPSLLRSFSLRTWRRPSDSSLSNDVSLSSRFSRWSRRRASASATDSTQQEHHDFLPLIRVVSPFFLSVVRIPPLFKSYSLIPLYVAQKIFQSKAVFWRCSRCTHTG